MKRLLCIVGSMNAGGAETFLMKIYRTLDKSQYQMDFAVAESEKGVYDDEILAMGGRIHHIVPKSKGLIRNFVDVRKLVKDNSYKYVLRVSQNSMSALELLAAWMGGARVRAFRSSNSSTTGGRKDNLIHTLCHFMPKAFANVRIAPSSEAADFMFGKNSVIKGKASLLHNAIDLNVYHFSQGLREAVRMEFGVGKNTVLLGHVGRFTQQKNHMFLLEVFSEVLKRQPDSKLLLVGKGELADRIRERAEQLCILDRLIFTGVRSDVPALLSAMDVFVFPSFYEGMPNTVIEAQACSLPCVIADTITKEAKITDLVTYLPLDAAASLWADRVVASMRMSREATADAFIRQGYDIESAAKEFVMLIFEK